MRLSILRFAVVVFAVFVLVPSNANAIIRTIDFTASNLAQVIGDPFGLLGLSSAPGSITGSFSIDTDATPFFGPTNFNAGTPNETTLARSPYLSFSVNIGGITVNGAPSINTQDDIIVNDAPGTNFAHDFRIGSTTDQILSTGIVNALFLQFLSTATSNPFNGTSVPTTAELNSIITERSFNISMSPLNFFSQNRARYNSIALSENLSAVPLPAALPLFGAGLALMGFIGWRRKRKFAAAA